MYFKDICIKIYLTFTSLSKDLFYLKCKVTEKGRVGEKRERELSSICSCCPNDCNSQGWGSKSQEPLASLGSGVLGYLDLLLLFSWVHYQEAAMKVEELKCKHAGVTGNGLTYCTAY